MICKIAQNNMAGAGKSRNEHVNYAAVKDVNFETSLNCLSAATVAAEMF